MYVMILIAEYCLSNIGSPALPMSHSGLRGLLELRGLQVDCETSLKSVELYATNAGKFSFGIGRHEHNDNQLISIVEIEAKEGINIVPLLGDITMMPGDYVIICCDLPLAYSKETDGELLKSDLQLVVIHEGVSDIKEFLNMTDRSQYSYLALSLNLRLGNTSELGELLKQKSLKSPER